MSPLLSGAGAMISSLEGSLLKEKNKSRTNLMAHA